MTVLASVIKRVAGWVWPPACPACGARLPWDSGVAVCAGCYKALPWWRTDMVLAPELRGVAGFGAPFLYEGVARELILKFKFADGLALAPLLAGWLAPHVEGRDVLLVPVPSHVSRLRWRGYSHTALLVRALARRIGRAYSLTALRRVTKTDGQVAKTRKQRLQLRGVDFWADERVVRGRDVVLVDDIVTTGGTAMACALALKRAGAASVCVAAVAYTPEGRDLS